MLGAGSKYTEQCYEENFIGLDYGMNLDLSPFLFDDWRKFNREMRPVYLEKHPQKSKIAAGLACGALWTVAKGLSKKDIVLCPDGDGNYYVGEIASGYYYKEDKILPHRRDVEWYPVVIERAAMSDEFQKSTTSGVIVDVSQYAEEIEGVIGGKKPPKIITTDETIENPSVFALEEHLEHFLVHNWAQTPLGKEYEIYTDEGEIVGKQFPTDTGPLDILAISKDQNTLLVVELKKGRASDNVVGQIQRYMGYIKDELAEQDQEVKGIIIALEDDMRIRRALSVTKGISFYRYKVNFELFKEI
jgi:restriction system protein